MNLNKREAYSDILKLDKLLSLQQPKTSKIDDRLFIRIHQACELYLSQFLVEITDLQSKFQMDARTGHILNGCARIVALFSLVCEQLVSC